MRIAASHGARDVRVFGSLARSETGPNSDLDIIAINQDVVDLLGCEVDVVTESAISPYIRELEDRLVLRHIERALPERIIREAQRSFTDTATGYRIAVATVVYRGVDHLMMVVFEEAESEIVAVSIHPLEERDVEKKISNGRWIT